MNRSVYIASITNMDFAKISKIGSIKNLLKYNKSVKK